MGKKKKFGFAAVAAGAAAAGAYHYLKGNGIFNKTRFKNQHEAIARYLEGHYPGAVYSPVKAEGDGWITVITTPDNNRISLSITKCEDNIYIFSETPLAD